ncbi:MULTISPECIES: hypothetical protein [Acinetobacter]|uniref:hypothetical protein n=1 Tax=Acinetobacter TaxID=469 RepID=UPI0004498BFF|nr:MULTISPECIES: hypothetical protein [Acinetobacter]HAV5332155.1 hypothetical protein [Acinetobacter baumannii]EXB83027.1 hypothetical protein J538_2298 [Acinetobacter sp. 272263]MCK4081807.1 hypothetical protein [Acinetobacter radioresistens]MCU4607608.1 hypothetical protein [Acinetobacter radioresistens]RSO65891.1 hypothetical protein EA749_11705 [Acinetobacter radioresistens]
MKIKTALLSLISVFGISISHADYEQAADSPAIETRQKQFNWTVYSLLNDFNSAKDLAVEALNANYSKEFSRQQCKKLNILEDLIKVTEANKDLESSLDTKATAEELLKTEQDLMSKGKVTKEDVCEHGIS